ncbi:MAG: deoxyribodipyrimidine photo-lyase [Gammaproteobacteria bacterium]
MATCLVWFRNDLRLHDNPALHHALSRADRVIPVYVHAPQEAAPWAPGGAARWWLHHSLQALQRSLQDLGTTLVIRAGDSLETLRTLAAETGAEAVVWNRAFEPVLAERDRRLAAVLQRCGVETRDFNASLLFEPGSVRTASGGPYRVFTPFWRACLRQPLASPPLPTPRTWPGTAATLPSLPVEALALAPQQPWDQGLRDAWRPGETAALERLAAFCRSGLAGYGRQRDFPAETGTSRLSPHLHHGEISPRQVAWTLRQQALGATTAGAYGGAEALLRELGWREFAYHILWDFPFTTEQALNPRFNNFPWQEPPGEPLSRWQSGRTGVPIVDAGMRELWHSGWMHNRVRMISASFLTKNCRVAWRHGARWFWDTLVDADLANNSMGWQWVAGSGADAAPYFRIFNPVTQGEKFDPEGAYVRRWLPELASLPKRWIHQPWNAPPEVQHEAGVVVGRHYPAPIVDLRASREQALAAYRRHVREGTGQT